MEERIYEFSARIEDAPESRGAYVRFPFDIRKEFGGGRVKVDALFDGVPYSGSIVNMGLKNEDGSICYIIGIRKDIRLKIGKEAGDIVSVRITPKLDSQWTCPLCGRRFNNRNQSHYCTHKPQTIEEYIALQSKEIQPYLVRLDEIIRKALPDTERKISWSMPTYWRKRNLIQFASFKNHIGLYPGPEAVAYFSERLAGYKTSKGAIQIPYGKQLPEELVADIAAWCGRCN